MEKTLVQRVVHVTPELIKGGKPVDAARCPVALALQDVFEFVSVGTDSSSLGSLEEFHRFSHSSALHGWINGFDCGVLVKPIDIAIDLENRRLWIA